MIIRACALALCVWSGVAQAAPQTPSCTRLFQQKKYARAGHCFVAQAEQTKAQTRAQKTRRGRLLRNAALSFSRAASASPHTSQAFYFRERALRVLKQYVRRGLYETIHRKHSALAHMYRLQTKLRYASLSIVTGSPTARLRITGFRIDEQAQGQRSLKLRPGPYRVEVRYPDAKPRSRRVTLLPGKRQIMTFQPPKPPGKAATTRPRTAAASTRPKAAPTRPHRLRGPLAISLLVAGGVGLIAGGALFGAARALEAERQSAHANALANVASQSPAETRALGELLVRNKETAEAIQPWGIGLAIAGAALLTAGVITWLALQGSPPSRSSQSRTRPSQSRTRSSQSRTRPPDQPTKTSPQPPAKTPQRQRPTKAPAPSVGGEVRFAL